MPVEKGLFEKGNAGLTLRDHISRYLSNWPFIVLSLLLCTGAGYIYTRYTPPKYIANTSFLIKAAAEKEAKSSDDLIEIALNGKRQINLSNEIQVISSSSLMERVVAKNGFNIDYYKKGKLIFEDVYNNAPFKFVPNTIADSSYLKLKIDRLNSQGGSLNYTLGDIEQLVLFKWNRTFKIGQNTYTLVPNNSNGINDNAEYSVTWQPIESAAASLSYDLGVNAYDKDASVIHLSLLTGNLQKGKDVLTALFNEFNLSDIEDRNKLSENTVHFIDERLNMITGELKDIEGNLESFRGNNNLIDVQEQSSISLDNSNDVSKNVKDINIQQGLVTMISNYFKNPESRGKLVPSSLGLNDPTLTSLIAQFNDLQLLKEREASMVAQNGLIMQDYNNRSNSLKSSIMESLNSISKNLKYREENIRKQNFVNRQFLSSLPRNERVLQEIKRKQSITEGLYLYLLQKREEAAISGTSSNASYYKQLNVATGYGPVKPNTRNILMNTALLGLFLPIGWIYLRGLVNNKVLNRNDIAKSTPIPILGDISHVPKSKELYVSFQNRDLLGEQFRIIRTNLVMMNRGKQVLLVTSSVSNEGKSFVCTNLAMVMAVTGKKVALLKFDLRKQTDHFTKFPVLKSGIAQFLSGERQGLEGLYEVSEECDSLHVFHGGFVPKDNPADMLVAESMQRLFSELRQQYDYVVIDSPPASLVTDPFILADYCDAVIYIVRERFTLKNHIDFLNEVHVTQKLNNIGLIVNDVKSSEKYGYYGYEANYKKKTYFKREKKEV